MASTTNQASIICASSALVNSKPKIVLLVAKASLTKSGRQWEKIITMSALYV